MHNRRHLGVNTPIDPSITWEASGATEPADFFSKGIPRDRALYGRFGHPNHRDLETLLARMEGGERALVFGSGMAATFALFFAILSPGDEIVVSSRIYGGTRGQINMLAHKLALRVHVVDITDLQGVASACSPETKLVFAETVSNPDMVVADIRALADICHRGDNDALLVVDNTFTPLIARPLTLGADIVMHSLTKYVNGRSDALGGALVGPDAMLASIAHPASGEASLVGGVLHYVVAQEMAERFVELPMRVREASRRASRLAQLFARAGLKVHYPHFGAVPPGQLECMGERLGGGVFSVAFPDESAGIRFVNKVKTVEVNDPLLGGVRLAIPCVSLGSRHTYVWCTTEARVQGKATKWSPLPFAPVPLGFVRVAVGYAGSEDVAFEGFERVLRSLKYKVTPEVSCLHT